MSQANKPEQTAAVVEEMVRRIVDGFSPEKVILFGSHARGDAGADSDVDLLVVIECDEDTRGTLVEIRRALADLPVAKDIIVVTPKYFARYRDVVGTVVWPATHEGRILYERAA